MRAVNSRSYCLLSCVLAGSVAGCIAPTDPMGTIRLDLTGQAASGATYRLRDAVISVVGPGYTRVWRTEDDPGRTSLSDEVANGGYAATLADGWRLERVDHGAASTVSAQLVSDNPVQFAVADHQRTSVPLQFRVEGEVVDMTQGYDLVLTIDEGSRSPTVVVANWEEGNGPSILVYEHDPAGDVAPTRTIAGPATLLSRPTGVTVDRGQIIVSDDVGAINFYPFGANGDVAPVQRISGSATQLLASNMLEVLVLGDEIFVSQNGSVLVFPRSASGDVAPRRVLSLRGGVGHGWGHLAIEGGEIFLAGPFLVADRSVYLVDVYPVTASGSQLPARTLVPPQSIGVDGCIPGGLGVTGGRIYESMGWCATGVFAFDKHASGDVAAVQSITGPNTGFVGPYAIAPFRDALYVTDVAGAAIRVFPSNGTGDIAPRRVIAGPHTQLGFPIALFVF
jgi:hypothetical protein